MKKIGIYVIASPSNKIYIGQSWDIDRRLKYYKYLSCKNQVKLYNSLLKYGYDSHKISILHQFEGNTSQELLNEKEQYYINLYKSNGFTLLNIREGGSCGKLTKETREKISISLKKTYENPKLREAISKRTKGNKYALNRKHTDEWKIQNSIRHKGRKQTQKHIDRMMNNTYRKGAKISDELKNKLSIVHKGNTHAKGFKQTKEQKERRSIFMKNSTWSLPKREVICLNNNVKYSSQREAAKILGISYKHIPDVCKGVRKHVGGYKFIYA